MARTLLASALVTSMLLAGCSAGGGSIAPSPATTAGAPSAGSPSAGSTGAPAPGRTAPDGRPFVVSEVAKLDAPWAMTFLPGTPWLAVTEKGGVLKLVDPASGDAREVAGTPQVADAGQGGLGDVVAGPTFEQDGTLYLSWVETGDGGSGAVIGRGRLDTDAARLDGLEVIWRQQPKVSGNGHFSHRMAFSPDGQHLFVSSGDRQKFGPAQDRGATLGKILRLTPDGEPADGNPFAGGAPLAAQVWTLGHRNPLGLAFDAEGRLWSSEMGPQGGDEINLIEEGRNYGWPAASNGSHYGGEDIPDHRASDGFEAPKVWWNPSVSPSSLMIYSGDEFPQWRGDAFFGALSGKALLRVDLDGTSATKGDQWDMGQRIREVEQGPDGAIWLLEDAPGGRLLRLDAP